jgi:tetrahydromethanopterin S-methyltransferase subunit G
MATEARAHYDDRVLARKAVDRLVEASFPLDRIHVHVDGAAGELTIRHKTGVKFGALVGTAVGIVFGVLFGVLVATGVIAPLGPDLGDLGPLVPIGSGLASGAFLGAFVGAIAGMAFWSKEVEFPPGIRERDIEISVRVAPQRAAQARALLQEAGASRVS